MITARLRIAAALAGLALAPAARAQGSVLDQPMEKEGWPVELTRRPLTLARDLLEVTAPLGIGLSAGAAGKPVFLAPSVYYGVADGITVGLRHLLGLCLTGQDGGCRHPYDDLGLDAVWRLHRGGGLELALGTALEAAPLDGPFALSGELRLVARLAAGPLALAAAPALSLGLTARDRASKLAPLAMPLASYPFGWVQVVPGNRELLSVPVTLQLQLARGALLAVGSALAGPLDPPGALGFGDLYTVPLGAALVLTPLATLDVGASFTFLDLGGKQRAGQGRADLRALQLLVAFRR